MLTRAKKGEIIRSLSEKFSQAEGVFVTTFKGFTVAESNEIRRLIREKDGEFKVAKNTLIRIASTNTTYENIMELVEGPTALVFAYKDPVEIAKTLNGFLKTHPSLKLRGFIIKGKTYTSEKLDELVKLPPREVLIAQLLGTMQAPLANFVGVLSAVIRNFLYVLKAIEEKKAKEGN